MLVILIETQLKFASKSVPKRGGVISIEKGNQTVKEELAGIQYLYLTTIGRISGEPRRIEIWFVEFQGAFYILAEHFHKAQWVRNIARNPRVHVSVGDQEFDATAKALDQERDQEVWQTVQRLSDEKYGWGEGLPVEIIRDE